jgi:hypothetical protein
MASAHAIDSVFVPIPHHSSLNELWDKAKIVKVITHLEAKISLQFRGGQLRSNIQYVNSVQSNFFLVPFQQKNHLEGFSLSHRRTLAVA